MVIIAFLLVMAAAHIPSSPVSSFPFYRFSLQTYRKFWGQRLDRNRNSRYVQCKNCQIEFIVEFNWDRDIAAWLQLRSYSLGWLFSHCLLNRRSRVVLRGWKNPEAVIEAKITFLLHMLVAGQQKWFGTFEVIWDKLKIGQKIHAWFFNVVSMFESLKEGNIFYC